MRLESVTLENFRSYLKTARLEFTKPINVFVGRNNSGKSNILEFLRWVSGPFTSQPVRSPAEYIHSGNRNAPFRASMVLALDDAERNTLFDLYLSKTDGHRVLLESANFLKMMHVEVTVDSTGILTETVQLSNTVDGWVSIGEQVVESGNITVRQVHLSVALQASRQYGNSNIPNNLIPRQSGTIMGGRQQRLLTGVTPRDLDDFVSAFIRRWHWFAPYRRPSITSQPKEDYVVQPSGQNLSSVFTTLQTSRETEFEDLRKDTQRLMPGVRISAPLTGNEVTIRIQEPGGVNVTLANTSEGVINALVIEGAAKTLPDNSLIMIEEPEVHLHAAAQRELLQIMREVSVRKNLQFLITTHSTIFAKADDLTDTWLVTKNEGISSVKKLSTGKDLLLLKRELGHENSDLFNSNAIVITEGESEEIAFPLIAADIGIDLIDRGVRIFNVRGSGQATRIELLLKYLKSSDTLAYLVLDNHGIIEGHVSDWIKQGLIDPKRVRIWPLEFEDTFDDETILSAMHSYNESEGVEVPLDVHDLAKVRSNGAPVVRYLQKLVFETTHRQLKKPALAEHLAISAKGKDEPSMIKKMLEAVAEGRPFPDQANAKI